VGGTIGATWEYDVKPFDFLGDEAGKKTQFMNGDGGPAKSIAP